MKLSRFLPALFFALIFTAAATQASEPRGERRGDQHKAPVEGLQLSSGLQASASLESASFGPRLTDEAWRKVFPIKDPPLRR